jgi:hypothetical protein
MKHRNPVHEMEARFKIAKGGKDNRYVFIRLIKNF